MCVARSDGTVGLDRTINLGSFFVTALVYERYSVVQYFTKKHQILIDIMLQHHEHKDTSNKTYFAFFSHLLSELKINSLELRLPEELIFGSDYEGAMPNTISYALQ